VYVLPLTVPVDSIPVDLKFVPNVMSKLEVPDVVTMRVAFAPTGATKAFSVLILPVGVTVNVSAFTGFIETVPEVLRAIADRGCVLLTSTSPPVPPQTKVMEE